MNKDLGVWTLEDCALLLIDYQNEMFETIRSETSADKFVKSLEQCVKFLGTQGIPGPYRWVGGMEGVKDRYLRRDAFGRQVGACMVDVIEEQGIFQSGDNPQEVLEPFFEEVFDKCGLPRNSNAAVS